MCFGGSSGPKYAPPLPAPAGVSHVDPVAPVAEGPDTSSPTTNSTTPTEARSTASSTGLSIPT